MDTNEIIIQTLAEELSCSASHVANVINLLDEGNTIPFIARYRKEAHGAMDDTSLRKLADRLNYLRNLLERKSEVERLIEAQGKLTEELSSAISSCKTLAELEDIYRPYRSKRRTRASIAKEKGLEPLAVQIFSQLPNLPAPEEMASQYLNEEKGVNTVEEALAGASDIIAETISDSADNRKALRVLYERSGILTSTASKDEESVYSHYYEFSLPIAKLQGHQILALNRGEKAGYLKITARADRDAAIALLSERVVKHGTRVETFVCASLEDSYDRLIAPSMENEIRSSLTETASEGAIGNFAVNLRPLLMQAPVKGKVVMGLDPGYRMGCKVAVVDPTGKVLDTTVVYPAMGEKQKVDAINRLEVLVNKHNVDHIAIGNGTASRETERATVELIQRCPNVSYMVVNEAGASVYSASPLAAEEFPQFDVNLRSAVSIARRMQDPLAELVKIEPKAIGVGQYQHDMPQKRLEESLAAVVEDCVNAVGVDLNTASASLLQRVSGLSSAAAKAIVAYREENGPYSTRKQVMKAPKVGPKTFQQCAGFLRVPESRNVLDNTGVHPESYDAAEKLLTMFGFEKKNIRDGSIGTLSEKVKANGEEKTAKECGVGVLTLRDIVGELQKPGRDPRDMLPPPVFRTDILSMKDLAPGMVLNGTVRNVIDFGAFIDIGVHQDGLVHISEISERYIRHPSEVVSVGDDVRVVILSIDTGRKRISLSMRQVKDYEKSKKS